MDFRWQTLIIHVIWETHDPGIVNRDSATTSYDATELKAGDRLRYNDPSGTLPSLKLIEIKEDEVTIQADGNEYKLKPGEYSYMGSGGKNYTEFHLSVGLLLSDKQKADVSGIRFPFQIYQMTEEQVATVKQSKRLRDIYLKALWLYYYNPYENAYSEAYKFLRYVGDKGISDAYYNLAEMFYNGTSGRLDMNEYIRLRNKAESFGSKLGMIARIEDLTFGICCDADPQKAIEEATQYLEAHAPITLETINTKVKNQQFLVEALNACEEATDKENVDPRLFVALGKAHYWVKNNELSTAYYRMAVSAGYVTAFKFLEITDDMKRLGRKLNSGYTICLEGEVEARIADLKGFGWEQHHRNAKKWLNEALKLGESEAAYHLGELYRNGTGGFEKDLDKAWQYFYRGFQLRHEECARMCALMIDCGEKINDSHKTDYYLGWSKRF